MRISDWSSDVCSSDLNQPSMVFSPRWRRREPGMSYSRWANSRTICCNSPRARRSRLTRGPSTDRRNKALGSIAFMGTHLVDEGFAAQLDSLGSDSGQNLWGVKSDRSAPSHPRSGAGHHGTTITRLSQVMASASDTDRHKVCQNSEDRKRVV